MSGVHCSYCGSSAELVDGSVIYPNRLDLASKNFWLCHRCNAYVGCHAAGDGTRPLGILANTELRSAKKIAHACFDQLWKSGQMSRTAAYAWLSSATGIKPEQCHIGMMDLAQCEAVVNACSRGLPRGNSHKIGVTK